MIKIENLTKCFGNKKVLKSLNLEIKTGETVVILGRSGTGKSVLLKHIMGIERPDSGSIYLDDVCLTNLKENQFYAFLKDMGMLFQAGALFDSLNVKENVAFYLRQHHNFSEFEIKEKVQKALSQVGLEGTESLMTADLSGGMRKRVALARLIIYRPKILLYDEPTTGLDPITAMQINDLILHVQKDLHATSIVVTHDLNSAFHVANRIALNHEGTIPYIATKEEFIKIDDPIIKSFLENSISVGVLN